MKIFFILLFCVTNIYAQDIITIRGHIVGNKSNEYLPYCSVQLKHSSVAVTANDTGDFELHINKSEMNDTLLISCIGYDLFVQSIEQVLSEQLSLFKLNEKYFTLNEVVIGPPINVKEVIKNVYEKFQTNYIQSKFYLDGFFRSSEKRNHKYNSLIEAAIIIKSKNFNAGKKHWNQANAYLKEVRSAYYASTIDTVDASNILNSTLVTCEVNMFEKLRENEAVMLMGKTEYAGSDKIVSLTYNKKNEDKGCTISGVFKINTTDWGIIEFEEVKKYTEKIIIQLNTDSLKARDYSSQFKCRYIKFEGHYYLSSAYFKPVRDIISPHQTTFTEYNAEYVTNKIYFDLPVKLSKDNLINRKKNLYKQVWKKPYHPEFWRTYNIIADNPELAKMRKDLNLYGSLEDQFNNPHKYQKNQ